MTYLLFFLIWLCAHNILATLSGFWWQRHVPPPLFLYCASVPTCFLGLLQNKSTAIILSLHTFYLLYLQDFQGPENVQIVTAKIHWMNIIHTTRNWNGAEKINSIEELPPIAKNSCHKCKHASFACATFFLTKVQVYQCLVCYSARCGIIGPMLAETLRQLIYILIIAVLYLIWISIYTSSLQKAIQDCTVWDLVSRYSSSNLQYWTL